MLAFLESSPGKTRCSESLRIARPWTLEDGFDPNTIGAKDDQRAEFGHTVLLRVEENMCCFQQSLTF